MIEKNKQLVFGKTYINTETQTLNMDGETVDLLLRYNKVGRNDRERSNDYRDPGNYQIIIP